MSGVTIYRQIYSYITTTKNILQFLLIIEIMPSPKTFVVTKEPQKFLGQKQGIAIFNSFTSALWATQDITQI